MDHSHRLNGVIRRTPQHLRQRQPAAEQGGTKSEIPFPKEGTWATLLFQVAGINKPLVSVSRLIDEGWRVVFDVEGSYLLHKKTKRKITMDRTRAVFTVEACNEPEDKKPVFTRPA